MINKLKALKQRITLFLKMREIAFAKFFVIAAILVLGTVILISFFDKPDLVIPENYNIKNNGNFETDQIEIIYSAKFDKYYVKIKYDEEAEFEDLKKEVEKEITKFTDLKNLSEINIEYFDARIITDHLHEEDGGNPIPLTEEDQ